jgi:hypothetical protein
MDKFKLAICVFVLLIFGCAGIKTGEKLTLFDETSRAYGRAIRWGDYQAAYAFKKLSDTDVKLPDFEDLRQIKVTSYKVKQTIISESKSKILRLVDIQYYKMNNVTVITLKDREIWEYNEEKERWYLTSELPDFK